MLKKIILGFTGTRQGLTDKQKKSFRTLIKCFNCLSAVEMKHGDCFGGDAESHNICREENVKNIYSYPCTLTEQRAYTDAIQLASPTPPLERNEVIAQNCDILIACPSSFKEERRSGTWATIRYRSKYMRKHPSNWDGGLIIIWPDGAITHSYD